MKKTRIIFSFMTACAILATGCAGQQDVDPAEAVGDGRVFFGPENVSVEIVELKTGPDILLRIGGTSSEIDSLVLDHKATPDGKHTRYVTRFAGRTLTTLINEGGTKGKWLLFLPETLNQSIELEFSENATKNLNKIELYEAHQALKSEGALAQVQEFDRARAERRETMALAMAAAVAKEKCETDITAKADWKSVSDDVMKNHSMAGLCVPPVKALGDLCEASGTAKDFLQASVKEVNCQVGTAPVALSLANGKLTWTVNTKADGLDKAALDGLKGQKIDDESTLKAAMALDTTFMCVYEKNSKYLVLAPDDSDFAGLSYGDGMQFVRIPTPKAVGPGWFYDPRNFNDKNPENHEGIDLRHYSRIEINLEKQNCRLYCGDRRFTFTLLPADDMKAMVPVAMFEPAPVHREPYALARDPQGTYYLVDRSTDPRRDKDFNLYIGRAGKMKRTPVKGVASDPQGEVFTSKAGQLRVGNEKHDATWTQGKKNTKLAWEPVKDNLQMIWKDMGVYRGQRLGTPCDDF